MFSKMSHENTWSISSWAKQTIPLWNCDCCLSVKTNMASDHERKKSFKCTIHECCYSVKRIYENTFGISSWAKKTIQICNFWVLLLCKRMIWYKYMWHQFMSKINISYKGHIKINVHAMRKINHSNVKLPSIAVLFLSNYGKTCDICS